MLPGKCSILSNKEILNLIFPGNDYTVTVIWLISSYVQIIYKEIFRSKKNLKLYQLIAALKVKYVKHMAGKRTRLKEIEFSAAQNFKVP